MFPHLGGISFSLKGKQHYLLRLTRRVALRTQCAEWERQVQLLLKVKLFLAGATLVTRKAALFAVSLFFVSFQMWVRGGGSQGDLRNLDAEPSLPPAVYTLFPRYFVHSFDKYFSDPRRVPDTLLSSGSHKVDSTQNVVSGSPPSAEQTPHAELQGGEVPGSPARRGGRGFPRVSPPRRRAHPPPHPPQQRVRPRPHGSQRRLCGGGGPGARGRNGLGGRAAGGRARAAGGGAPRGGPGWRWPRRSYSRGFRPLGRALRGAGNPPRTLDL